MTDLKIFEPGGQTEFVASPVGRVITDEAEYVWWNDGTWKSEQNQHMADVIMSVRKGETLRTSLAGEHDRVLAEVAALFKESVHPKWECFLKGNSSPTVCN